LKIRNLIAITTIVITITTTGKIFAHDCGIVAGGGIQGVLSNYKNFNYTKVVPEVALEKALTNLKAYCCAQTIPCSDDEVSTLPEVYPESPYFFDQLLDVTMRRLDGTQSLAYGLVPDPAGKQRREFITEVANDPNGAQAKAIEKNYASYRTLHLKTKVDIIAANFDKENTAEISLGDKYNNVCKLMKIIYEKLQEKDNPIIIWLTSENNSFFKKCENLVAYRVSRENAYVKLLMIKKSSQLMDETTKAYTKKYFVEEKLMSLWTLISKVKDVFQTIVQQAAASKTCSK
jgi:hypothetical protein